MNEPARSEIWERLTSYSDTFTCYSSAVATWVACERADWERVINPGLTLTVTEAGGGLFGFAHFPPALRAVLGLVRRGADDVGAAVEGVLAELARSGRVIVAGDGFHLPWHVARGRRHVPHWYVLIDGGEGPEVVDPFACRNELGSQTPALEPVALEHLGELLAALPGDDRVPLLREALALGDDAGPPPPWRHQWFVFDAVDGWQAPQGPSGDAAVARLAAHFREHGQRADAYAQADDLWSIARHRAFLCAYAREVAQREADGALEEWVTGHAEPLARRWGHIAPLIMQATLAIGSGRAASASVPDTLDALAVLERDAVAAFPAGPTGERTPEALEGP